MAQRKAVLKRAVIRAPDRQGSAAQFQGIEREGGERVITWTGDGTYRLVLETLERHSSTMPSAVAALDMTWSGFLGIWQQPKDVQPLIADVVSVETS